MNAKCLRLLIGLALSAAVLLPQTRVLAQQPAIDTALAYQYFQEADALCRRDNGKLWGISLCGPMLFVDRKSRTVVANQADREGILTKSGNVFVLGTAHPNTNDGNIANFYTAKYAADGALLWETRHDASIDWAAQLALDGDGNV